jgi:hypothetical protein
MTPNDSGVDQSSLSSTPIEVVAQVSRVVTAVVDRLTGDRSDVPLMVAAAVVQALRGFNIHSQVMYGQAAWIEVMEDHTVLWAGCWGTHLHFWVATQYGEVVDLNTSVAHRKVAHDRPGAKPKCSPPMLWSAEVPRFYRYIPEGVAEVELTDPKDIERYGKVIREIQEKCTPQAIQGKEPEFPNEPILCSGRRLLDDSQNSFRHFDRYLGVSGIPHPPI